MKHGGSRPNSGRKKLKIDTKQTKVKSSNRGGFRINSGRRKTTANQKDSNFRKFFEIRTENDESNLVTLINESDEEVSEEEDTQVIVQDEYYGQEDNDGQQDNDDDGVDDEVVDPEEEANHDEEQRWYQKDTVINNALKTFFQDLVTEDSSIRSQLKAGFTVFPIPNPSVTIRQTILKGDEPNACWFYYKTVFVC
jgi:hypothetical protein